MLTSVNLDKTVKLEIRFFQCMWLRTYVKKEVVSVVFIFDMSTSQGKKHFHM